MTTPIRPGAPQVQPHQGPAVDPGKLAAQRAFFQAALGKAGAPQAAAAAPAAPPAAPQSVQRTAASAPADAPQKILRPGSLIDIRV